MDLVFDLGLDSGQTAEGKTAFQPACTRAPEAGLGSNSEVYPSEAEICMSQLLPASCNTSLTNIAIIKLSSAFIPYPTTTHNVRVPFVLRHLYKYKCFTDVRRLSLLKWSEPKNILDRTRDFAFVNENPNFEPHTLIDQMEYIPSYLKYVYCVPTMAVEFKYSLKVNWAPTKKEVPFLCKCKYFGFLLSSNVQIFGIVEDVMTRKNDLRQGESPIYLAYLLCSRAENKNYSSSKASSVCSDKNRIAILFD